MQDAAFLLEGVRKERVALKSGVCRVRQRFDVSFLADEEKNSSGEYVFLIAFDGNERIRFDRSGPGLVVDLDKSTSDPKEPGKVKAVFKQGTVSSKYYKDKGKAVLWEDGRASIDIVASASRPPKQQPGYFDVHGMGLYSVIDLGRRYDLRDLLDEYSKIKRTEVRPSSDQQDVYVMEWTSPDDPLVVRWRLWIDVAHGFTPIRLEQSERPREVADIMPLVQSFQVRWEQREGVWVPIRQEMSVTPTNRKWKRTDTLEITWESVNKPVPDELFDMKSFEAPDSVGIVDVTLGEPVVVKAPDFAD
jgi:hypothetical protein